MQVHNSINHLLHFTAYGIWVKGALNKEAIEHIHAERNEVGREAGHGRRVRCPPPTIKLVKMFHTNLVPHVEKKCSHPIIILAILSNLKKFDKHDA